MTRLFRTLAAPLLLALTLFLGSTIAFLPAYAQTALLPGSGAEEPAAPTSAATLLDLLRNDQARAELIAELERVAAAGEPATPAVSAPSDEILSFGRSAALFTQEAAESVATSVRGLWDALKASPELFAGLSRLDLGVLGDALIELLLLIVATAAIFNLLRRAVIPTYRRMGQRARSAGVVKRILLYVGALA
ncbi:mechanosensitive ion channel protein MscS, partial [Rhodobacter sphaeroides]|nr:mechanosensitive ion channel protein MscS [Cereibacter sphaeroides]